MFLKQLSISRTYCLSPIFGSGCPEAVMEDKLIRTFGRISCKILCSLLLNSIASDM